VSAPSGDGDGVSTVADGLLAAASNGAFSVTAGVEDASPSCWARAAATDSSSKQTQKQAEPGFMLMCVRMICKSGSGELSTFAGKKTHGK
jgi:hypothetical protein